MEEFSTYGLWFQSLHEIWQRKVFHVRYYDFQAHLSSKSFITSLMTHSSHHLSTMTCKKWIFFYLCCCLLVCSPYAFTYRNFVVPPYIVRAKASYCTNRVWKSGKFLFGFVGNIGKKHRPKFSKRGKSYFKNSDMSWYRKGMIS